MSGSPGHVRGFLGRPGCEVMWKFPESSHAIAVFAGMEQIKQRVQLIPLTVVDDYVVLNVGTEGKSKSRWFWLTCVV